MVDSVNQESLAAAVFEPFRYAYNHHVRLLSPEPVWHLAERNPFHYTLSRVIERYVESPLLAPDAPDAFRFAAPGKLRDVLAEGWRGGSSERLLQFTVRAPISAEDFWDLRCEMSEKLREKAATLSSEQLTQAKRQALEALRAYSTNDGDEVSG